MLWRMSQRPSLLALALLLAGPLAAEPLLSSWYTANSTKYARIYSTDAARLAGTAVTTWSNTQNSQTSPAYAGAQEISYSASWVYVRSTGLGGHVMGPWYLNAAHTQAFPGLPVNQKTIFRFPRTPGTVPTTKTLTGLGAIGVFVDGVAMFDSRDGQYWTGTAEANGNGFWNREAYVNEGVTFDPAYAHQPQNGQYHYHANPIALRYLLGDHVDFNATTRLYSESTGPVTRHSPILGWARDGYPIYGPYGYSSALDASSALARMRTGYALRDGTNGTDNLATTGRTSIPAWATRLYGASTVTGPAVSTTYPLGRYMEDNAYLGDLGRTQGVDFDLDQYNGRFCVTPEFPNGTYAYFVAINASGAPTFPYNIGRAFYGDPTGNTVTSITETVTTFFAGDSAFQEQGAVTAVNGSDVTFTWSSIEGGTYTVEATNDLAGTWTTLSTTQAAASNATKTSYTETGAAPTDGARFYRVNRTALATHDAATGTTGGGGGGTGTAVAAPGGSARAGQTVTMTITLPTTPPLPPANVVPQSATLAGTIAGTTISRPTQATAQATFAIPSNAPLGTQNVTVVFNPGPTYTVTFTILAAN